VSPIRCSRDGNGRRNYISVGENDRLDGGSHIAAEQFNDAIQKRFRAKWVTGSREENASKDSRRRGCGGSIYIL
jgi:hypothetical protein